MRREELGDLAAFLAVAEERSFTRAAAKLGTSQSALSHTVRRLETRLGLRLLTRTTRSVAPTDAGERLIETLRPALDEIDGRLAALTELREKPAGTIRITTAEHAAQTILWPALARVLPHYPDIKVELTIDYGLTDIVAERYDAGVRLGEQVAKDMIAVPIGPEMRMAAVGAPSHFAARPIPKKPPLILRVSAQWEVRMARPAIPSRPTGYRSGCRPSNSEPASQCRRAPASPDCLARKHGPSGRRQRRKARTHWVRHCRQSAIR